MKNFLIFGAFLFLGCGPSGPSDQDISLAEKNYNQNFLNSFNEEKAFAEGCFSSKEFIDAAYADGKLDISENAENKDYHVYLETKKCISDLISDLIESLNIENDILLECDPRRPFYISYGVDKNSQEKDRGQITVIRLIDRGYLPYLDFNTSEHRWRDDGYNKAKYYSGGGTSLGVDYETFYYLDRESLTFATGMSHKYGESTNESWKCKKIEKKMFPSILKDQFLQASNKKEAEEAEGKRRIIEKQKSEEEKKKRRKL